MSIEGVWIRRLLLEALHHQRADWHEASADTRLAFEYWSRASARDRADAFASYRAALDREEQASTIFQDLLITSNRTF